jgi:hypothetical protein
MMSRCPLDAVDAEDAEWAVDAEDAVAYEGAVAPTHPHEHTLEDRF